MAVKDTAVKTFFATMTDSGGPINYSAGSLVSVLDKLLVNGFNSVTIDSCVIASGIATITVAAGHNFAMLSTILGPVISLSGATPSELNREWRIEAVNSTTEFTIDVTGVVSDQTATGTITAKYAPLGWEILYTGTNKRVYAPTDTDATGIVLFVNDSTAAYGATCQGALGATDVDTPVNAFGTRYFQKSRSTTLTNYYHWQLSGDSLCFWWALSSSANSSSSVLCVWNFFGDLVLLPGYEDTKNIHGAILGNNSNSISPSVTVFGVNNTTHWILTQTENSPTFPGTGVAAAIYGAPMGVSYLGNGASASWPCDYSDLALLFPIYVQESGAGIRGIAPGVYDPAHTAESIAHTEQFVGGGASPRQYHAVRLDKYAAVFDLTGPWR